MGWEELQHELKVQLISLRPKTAFATPKQNDGHNCLFHKGVPLPHPSSGQELRSTYIKHFHVHVARPGPRQHLWPNIR